MIFLVYVRNPNYFTATQSLVKHVSSPGYIDMDRGVVHKRLADMSKVTMLPDNPTNIDDGTLWHIRDRTLMYQFGKQNAVLYPRIEERFLGEIWPEIYPRAKKNPGMTQFLLENAPQSEFIMSFMPDVWHCPAKAVLPAHAVADDMLGDPAVIPKNDPMFPFCHDQSYRMIRYRTKVPQEYLKKAKKILFAGGGLVPELWTNSYPFGKLDQEAVVYDTDASLPAYLEKILGGKPSDFGIDYRVGDFMDAFGDESQWGSYDVIVCNGVMSYHTRNPEELDALFAGFAKLLAPGGKLFFDVQLKHPVLLFDVLVLEWPATMDTLPGFQAAVDLIDPYLSRYGFVNIQHSSEDFNAGGSPAGMITVAEKA